MGTPEPDSLDDLIADCAAMPASLRSGPTVLPGPRYPTWTVDDAIAAQAADMDEFV